MDIQCNPIPTTNETRDDIRVVGRLPYRTSSSVVRKQLTYLYRTYTHLQSRVRTDPFPTVCTTIYSYFQEGGVTKTTIGTGPLSVFGGTLR